MLEGVDISNVLLMGCVNITYAAICIAIGIVAMVIGYKVFDALTPFNTAKLLEKDPRAVGIFNGLVALGIGVCAGLITGLSCN